MQEFKREFLDLSIQHWLSYEFLTWRWFLKVVILISAIIVCVKLIDKKRAFETVAYGLLVSLVSTALDAVGTGFAFWEYPVRLLPLEFSEIHDFVLIPVVYMLLYQRFVKWKEFIIADALVSVLGSFIVEPVFAALGFYRVITWRHIYSLPIFFAIAAFSKFIIDKLKAKDNGV